MGFIYNDGKAIDPKLEALRQAEKALETARQLLSRARAQLILMPAANEDVAALYGDIANFLGD